jgi:protein-tyrosine phosphatase
MRYAIVFSVLGFYLIGLAVVLGGWVYLLGWPALGFLLLAIAYAGAGPALLGKRPDGRLAWWAFVLFGPVLFLLWTVWHLQRLVSREAPCHEVAPGLWLGRRPFAHEIPAEVMLIVDLTAEFPLPCGLGQGREYLVLPTLDGIAPDEARLRALVVRVANSAGPVYMHCAMGHGRSATLAAAVLVFRGLAVDPREAEKRIRRVRPGVRLNSEQRAVLIRICEVRVTAQ